MNKCARNLCLRNNASFQRPISKKDLYIKPFPKEHSEYISSKQNLNRPALNIQRQPYCFVIGSNKLSLLFCHSFLIISAFCGVRTVMNQEHVPCVLCLVWQVFDGAAGSVQVWESVLLRQREAMKLLLQKQVDQKILRTYVPSHGR